MTTATLSLILRAHTMSSPGDHYSCLCGHSFHTLGDWSDHVAAVVMASDG